MTYLLSSKIEGSNTIFDQYGIDQASSFWWDFSQGEGPGYSLHPSGRYDEVKNQFGTHTPVLIPDDPGRLTPTDFNGVNGASQTGISNSAVIEPPTDFYLNDWWFWGVVKNNGLTTGNTIMFQVGNTNPGRILIDFTNFQLRAFIQNGTNAYFTNNRFWPPRMDVDVNDMSFVFNKRAGILSCFINGLKRGQLGQDGTHASANVDIADTSVPRYHDLTDTTYNNLFTDNLIYGEMGYAQGAGMSDADAAQFSADNQAKWGF